MTTIRRFQTLYSISKDGQQYVSRLVLLLLSILEEFVMNIRKLSRFAQEHVAYLVEYLENEQNNLVKAVLKLDTILNEDAPFVIFMRFWSDFNLVGSVWANEDFLAMKERLNDLLSQIPNERIEKFIKGFSGINWIISVSKTIEDYQGEFLDQKDYSGQMCRQFDFFQAYACCLAVAEERHIEVDGEEDYNICVNKLKQLRESDAYGFLRLYITAILITMREDQTLLKDRLSYLSSVISE